MFAGVAALQSCALGGVILGEAMRQHLAVRSADTDRIATLDVLRGVAVLGMAGLPAARGAGRGLGGAVRSAGVPLAFLRHGLSDGDALPDSERQRGRRGAVCADLARTGIEGVDLDRGAS